MQYCQNKSNTKYFFPTILLFLTISITQAQVNTVEFGKNRLQFKNFKWKYYQTPNFNTYFSQNGQPIAEFVAQLAEKELAGIEQFTEYGLQRRANLVVYNSFNEMEQSNIGLSLDWQTTGGITKLVNNKVVLYYTDDYNQLRIQVREGIARILVENILFGDDLGEFAANQTLLDLPQWLVDGYIAYAAENWNPTLDDQLKSAILSGKYNNFYQFAFEKPLLAGHAFWYYLAGKYKKENVTYFLYLSRVYRNLNNASQRICKKKFKEVLKDFMEEEEQVYDKDIRGRRNMPKGTVSVVETLGPGRDFFHFSPSPQPKSQTYAVVQYVKGQYCVVLHENYIYTKVLLKTGVRMNDNQINPHYPLLAWDPKGTRLTVVYWDRGKVHLFVYDVSKRYKPIVQDLDMFDQVQDVKYMLDYKTLILSAVKNGQSDIFVYKMEQQSLDQITNDVYNDLDASFVSFPGKTGIMYSSNRPSANAPSNDTVLPSNNHYNIFLIDNWNKSEFKQISQLTRMKYSDARYPSQYNNFHFTFVSEENGIANRYAGFFTTRRAGLDTVYRIGDELLHNPDPIELDSVLKAYKKTEPDSMYAFSITNDSAYVFPITNYQSGLIETKTAGDNGLVSEVRQEGDLKFLYKLKVDDAALKKRNINPKLTEFRRKQVTAMQISKGGELIQAIKKDFDTAKKKGDFFENEFEQDKNDTATKAKAAEMPKAGSPSNAPDGNSSVGQLKDGKPAIQDAKLYDYKLKFSVDNFTAGFNNDVLITNYQPFTGSVPITMSGADAFSGMFKASVFDLFEDWRFTGAFRLPFFSTGDSPSPLTTETGNTFTPNGGSFLDGNMEWFARADYLKKMFDFSLIYYRETETGTANLNVEEPGYYDSSLVGGTYYSKSFTNIYEGVIKYPFDRIRSLRLTLGIRTDRWVLQPTGDPSTDLLVLSARDINDKTMAISRLEYVYDNSILKTTNIWNGLRYKFYMEFYDQINQPDGIGEGRKMFNFGFDARNYYPIYRNLIWALRAAGDFSWGNQKIIYYLGGTDGWLFPKAYQTQPAQDNTYAYQSLAVNLRGFDQNIANGNNNVVINSELRLPIFSTLFNKPINNAFLRNFQLVQFFDLGSAWNGNYNKIQRPSVTYTTSDSLNPVTILVRAGGIGPFAGGYGFGVRSTLLGYFLRCDVGWQMNTFFGTAPVVNVSMGVDF
jgi:hypothetical protein